MSGRRPESSDVADDDGEQRRGLLLVPSRLRNPLNRANRGQPIDVVRHEFGQRLERLGFLTANTDQCVHRRPADERLGAAAFERELCPAAWGREFFLLEHLAATGVEHLEREVIEPLAETVVAVEDHDGIDGGLFTEIHFPPGIGRVFLGCVCPPPP